MGNFDLGLDFLAWQLQDGTPDSFDPGLGFDDLKRFSLSSLTLLITKLECVPGPWQVFQACVFTRVMSLIVPIRRGSNIFSEGRSLPEWSSLSCPIRRRELFSGKAGAFPS